MINKLPELVAPAGSLQKLKYALAYGADAVYAGVPRFSLRARENQFDEASLAEAVQYTQNLGKKIFLTLNIFPHNRKIDPFEGTLKQMSALKPDALILSDPGVIALARELCPDIPIHLSTQANTVNWRSVKFWGDLGIRRIILSRELSIEEIREIRDKNPDIELEAFAHGAICVAYSGRCLLSNYFTHRDPNQGTCTNSCRWKYNVYQEEIEGDKGDTLLKGSYFIEEQDRRGELLPIDEDEFGTYIMNSKDLCTIGLLDRIYDAGVDSFKIEGRTKSVYYLSIITRAYHKALEQIQNGKTVSEDLHREVWAVANRDYITGFLEKNPKENGENFRESHSGHQTHKFCGIIQTPAEPNGRIRINVRNRFEVGDEMEIVTPESIVPFKLDAIYTLDGQKVNTAHGGGADMEINNPGNFREYSLLRKKLNL